jgi:hypothetical protein
VIYNQHYRGVVILSTHDGKLVIQRIKSSFVQDIRL